MKKFEFYLFLRDKGITEEHAIKITKQATKSVREALGAKDCDASGVIMSFSAWSETEEGWDYWDGAHASYE